LKQTAQVGRKTAKPLKHSLNQAQATFNDCQISILQVKHKTWVQNETKQKNKCSPWSTLKNILQITYCIYHT